ncbi:MAG TPA: hypothetical protein VKB93_12960 [Thermoanaerobaculia bacterium]|nr:hypothetical protein [Thermoanaerobaculia bacterium]
MADRIRRIFFHQQPHVSCEMATTLLGWTSREMTDAIRSGEIDLQQTPFGTWIWRDELMAKALELWPQEVIEEALGKGAERVLPAFVRLAHFRARIPEYQRAMLEYLAERDGLTVSDVLTRELDGIASSYFEELTERIPEFAEALLWPELRNAPVC